jgi:hypothetical protein
MASHEETIEIFGRPEQIFDLVHDYSRRLEWDSFLRAAAIVDGGTAAGIGVRTRCAARLGAGGMSMETVYVAFDRPTVAAVKLTAGPPLFSAFAASIRQTALASGLTRVSYKYTLQTRPRWLRGLLEPLVSRMLARETRRHLADLKRFVEASPGGHG